MAETDTTSQALPVVPLPDGVVFPGTVVTLALESSDAHAAITATMTGDRRVLLVPQVDGRVARVGVIAHVENAGELPGGGSAAIIRGLQRARLGAAVVTERSGLWVQAEPVTDGRPTVRIEEMARQLRVVLEDIATARNSRRLPEILRTVTDPGALADAATAWSEASLEHKLTILETIEVGARVAAGLRVGQGGAGRAGGHRAHPHRGHATAWSKQQREFLLRQQLAAIRKELGDDDDDPSSRATAPGSAERRPARVGP